MMSGEYPAALTKAIAVAAVVSLAGLLAAGSGYRPGGAYAIIAGSIAFVPLGLVAVFGGRKILDELSAEGLASGGVGA